MITTTEGNAPMLKDLEPNYTFTSTLYDEQDSYDSDASYDGSAVVQTKDNDRINVSVL